MTPVEEEVAQNVRALVPRAAPLLLVGWGLLVSGQDRGDGPEHHSFPIRVDSIARFPSILGDKESLITSRSMAPYGHTELHAPAVIWCSYFRSGLDDGPQPQCGAFLQFAADDQLPVPKAA